MMPGETEAEAADRMQQGDVISTGKGFVVFRGPRRTARATRLFAGTATAFTARWAGPNHTDETIRRRIKGAGPPWQVHPISAKPVKIRYGLAARS
jgi:hypothetical protein